MQLKETQKELEKFAKYVIQQARTNLSRKKDNPTSNSTKMLYNSLSSKPLSQGLGVQFSMLDYGKFQDQGVKGTKSNYIVNKNSPFSYKKIGSGLKGMPPPDAFAGWAKRKGIKGRDAKTGRFITDKSLQFLIARSVFQKGIRASMFFTKPFEAAFERLPEDLQEKFGIDLENLILKEDG